MWLYMSRLCFFSLGRGALRVQSMKVCVGEARLFSSRSCLLGFGCRISSLAFVCPGGTFFQLMELGFGSDDFGSCSGE